MVHQVSNSTAYRHLQALMTSYMFMTSHVRKRDYSWVGCLSRPLIQLRQRIHWKIYEWNEKEQFSPIFWLGCESQSFRFCVSRRSMSKSFFSEHAISQKCNKLLKGKKEKKKWLNMTRYNGGQYSKAKLTKQVLKFINVSQKGQIKLLVYSNEAVVAIEQPITWSKDIGESLI